MLTKDIFEYDELVNEIFRNNGASLAASGELKEKMKVVSVKYTLSPGEDILSVQITYI